MCRFQGGLGGISGHPHVEHMVRSAGCGSGNGASSLEETPLKLGLVIPPLGNPYNGELNRIVA